MIENKMNNINVVCALIFIDKKVLIAKRSTDKDAKGKWEFPGGKVEKNESYSKAIEREIYEELCIKVKTRKYIFESKYNYPHGTVLLKLYECKYVSGSIKLNAHNDFALVDIKDLLKYDLAPADISLAKYVIKNYKEMNYNV